MDETKDEVTGLTRHLRVASWNLNHWRQAAVPVDTRRGAWDYLAALGVDVALVQEAVPPAGVAAEHTVYGEIAGHRNWGSAVVAMGDGLTLTPVRSARMPWSRRHYLLANTHPGAVAVAELELHGIQPITLMSIYGVMDGSAASTMLRVIADLIPLSDSPQGSRVILAGDFNVSRSTADPRSLARAVAVLDAVRALGLVEVKSVVAQPPPGLGEDCPCGRGRACDHVATWKAAELDHLFVSPSLAGQVTRLAAPADAVAAGLSDHVPLVMDLELTAERTAHGWDEEAFAVEIGRRHGPATREVVERLVAWADDTERRLGEEDGVRTRALTRFPTNGVTTEPEVWFPLDFNLAPAGSQATIAIRARGDVVLQFGRMRHPPFDTADGRRPLRRALNAIDGIDIPRWKLDGWPSFPLSVLEDPDRLAAFVAVLDTIVRESRPLLAVPVPGVAAA